MKRVLQVRIFIVEPDITSHAAKILLHDMYRSMLPMPKWAQRLKDREQLIKRIRDAGIPFVCQYCGRDDLVDGVDGVNRKNRLTLDHIFPISLGGDNRPHNLALSCFKCNSRKGSIMLSQEERAKIKSVATLLDEAHQHVAA